MTFFDEFDESLKEIQARRPRVRQREAPKDNVSPSPSQRSTPVSNNPNILYWRLNDKEHGISCLTKSLNRIFDKNPKIKKHYSKINSDRSEHLTLFLNDFLPQNIEVNYFATNLSLKDESEKRIKLSLRAPNHGNFIHLLESNAAISIKGFWPTKSRNPVFIPEDIFVTHNDEKATKYEVEIDVAPSCLAPGRDNSQNALTPSLAEKLPLISVKTSKNLADWLEFIEFKRELVKEKTLGLRYLKSELNTHDQLVFTIISNGQDNLQKASKVFNRKSLEAFDASASSETCEFKVNENKNNKSPIGFELGQIKGSIKILPINELSALNKSLDILKIDDLKNPVWGQITIELAEDWKNKLSNANRDAEDDNTEIATEYTKLKLNLLSCIPDYGFISFQSIGDLTLINRHARVIKNLIQSENCYSPYLSTYLFDIKEAGNMENRPTINKWFNPQLQEAQKEAVKKMIGSPDLCLIQGPPGTGKTTVIAEAILQLASRGEKVLLASQAHDAIDNALSRIQNNPELRAIRLAKNSDKITDEGKAFSGVRALERYYESLKSHTSDNWLKPYQQKIDEINRLEEWLEKSNYIQRDLSVTTEDYNLLKGKIIGLKKQNLAEQKSYKFNINQHNERIELLEKIKRTIRVLQNLDEDIFIPEGVLTNGSRKVAGILFNLTKAKISLSHTVEAFERTPQSRGIILTALLSEWSNVKSRLEKMDHDLLVLKNAGNNSLKNEETESAIRQLNRTIGELEDQLDQGDDIEVSAKWRKSRAKIIALKNSSQGLDSDVYSIFTDSNIFYDITNASDVYEVLESRVNILKNIDKLLSISLETLIDELICSSRQINTQEPTKQRLNAIELDITSLSLEIKQKKLIIEQFSQKADSLLKEERLSLSVKFTENIINVQKYYDSQRERTKEQQSLQEPWNNFFKDWVDNLAEDSAAESDWEHLERSYIENCNLFAISCNEGDRTLQDAGVESFDVAIIDEVSKATPIEMLLPLMRARRAVLVGDHRQLPPIFQESQDAQTFADKAEEMEEDGTTNLLTKDNIRRFEKMVTSSLFKEHFEAADPSIRERLTVQYRMHPEIMGIVNKFYEGQLICGNPELPREHGITLEGKINTLLTPQDHVLWIDTSRNLQGQKYIEKEGQTNPLEAELIATTLIKINRQMQAQGFNKKNKQRVGVVSFYAAQCREIRNAINRLNNGKLVFDSIHVEINTVIRYQGKEKPIILISLVRNDGQAKEKRRSANANIARFEFINVAVSRAQNLLIIFGARNMLECRDVILPNMDTLGVQKKQIYRDIFGELDRAARIYLASEMTLETRTQQKRFHK